MDSKANWGKPAGDGDAIGGDRRQNRRYQLQLDLKWKLIRRRRVLDTGTGQTIDVSSGGICFDAGRHLPEGLNVELSISWPVLLHNVAPMQLVATGKIVRTNGRMASCRNNSAIAEGTVLISVTRSAAASAGRASALSASTTVPPQLSGTRSSHTDKSKHTDVDARTPDKSASE